MAQYEVKFYNRASEWYFGSIFVDAVTEGAAETQARNEFGPDESYYRTGVVEVEETAAEEATETPAEEDAEGDPSNG